MPKDGKGTPSAQDWVEVADEPNHEELFENEQVRVYVAVIRPGRETAYHRHEKDTLYVVLEGGKNYSTTYLSIAGFIRYSAVNEFFRLIDDLSI